MLQNTFSHIPGIGTKSEQKLWDIGIMAWENLNDPDITALSQKRRTNLKKHVDKSTEQMKNNHFKYFENLLPAKLHWRFFPEVRKSTVYLDIETTGMEVYDQITTIALYDGKDIRYYVNGENLNDFPADINDYTTLVTYNGKCFDIPFINTFANFGFS